MAKHKYSLWFMPAGTVAQRFSQIIVQLAKDHASPIFSPHVTLLGSIEASQEEVINRTQELAALLRPFLVPLTTITFTDAYYRALFVKAGHSTEALAAYELARKLFPGDQQTAYMPHLSLLYGDFSVAIKQEIIKEIGENFPDAFEANTLYLYLTEGAAHNWQSIRAFPLEGPTTKTK